ncbi:ABC transporter substrate-binding protein [Salana multivorans]
MARTAHLVLASALLLAVSACGAGAQEPETATSSSSAESATTDPAEETIPIVLGLTYVPDIQFAPFYSALAEGYYAEAGFDVTLRHHGANEGLFSALEAGEEDLVVASGDEVLASRAGGSDLQQIATVYAHSPVALIAPVDSEVAQLEDLAGHTVGIPGEYGSTYLGLQMLLAEHDLTLDDITVQNIGYTQVTALLTGQVDAVMGFSNSDAVRLAEADLPVQPYPVSNLVSIGIAAPESTPLTEEQLAAFRDATMRGAAAVAEDPAAAVEIAATHIPGMTSTARQDALAVIEASVELYGVDGITDPARWSAMADAMLAAGMIESIPSDGYLNPGR